MYDIKKVQRKAIEIYLYFSNFCDKYGLRYFVIGGACIGAVRHRGFIPWDDDIDIFMPRPDYEKFTEIWDKYGDKSLYSFCRTDQTKNFKDAGALFKDNNTTFINKHSKDDDIHHGYMIDIIPIDGCAPGGISRLRQKFHASIYSLFNVQRLPQNQSWFVKCLTGLILTLVPSKNIRYKIWRRSEKIMSQYSFDDSQYITELVTGFRYMNLEYPSAIFSDFELLDFEDIKIKVPKGYKTYLSMAFGDYMKMPPKSERKPKHNIVFLDMDKSYKQYRGIYYCVVDKK